MKLIEQKCIVNLQGRGRILWLQSFFTRNLHLNYFIVENILGMRTEREIKAFLFHFSFFLSSWPCPRPELLPQFPCVNSCLMMKYRHSPEPQSAGWNLWQSFSLLLGLLSGSCVLCQTPHGQTSCFEGNKVPNHEASIHQSLRLSHSLDWTPNAACQKHAWVSWPLLGDWQ